MDWEEWFGSKGLLLVGVVALLAAGAFFFKYAFDRDWVAPGLRVLGGLASGVALALAGEWQVARGMRRYGLAMIGAGGGLVFLALWAASGRYDMIPRQAGTMLIAVITAVTAWRAAHHDAEGLTLWALLGAYSAPVLLAAPDSRPELLMAYSALVSYAAGALAHHAGWRRTFNAALVGYFVVVPALIPKAMPTTAGLAYVTLGGMMALLVLQGRRWGEARIASQGLAWLLLGIYAASIGEAMRWPAAGFAAALLLATWWDCRADERFQREEPGLELDEHGFVFLLAPAAFTAVLALLRPGLLATAPEIATTAAAALYLFTGWRGRWSSFVAVGFALLAVAIAQQWNGAMLIVEWSLLILLAVAAESRLDQRGGVPVGLIAAPLAFIGLLVGLTQAQVAFVGSWPFALYGYVAAMFLAAWAWRPRTPDPEWHESGAIGMWTLGGVALFAGITIELNQYFGARALTSGSSLAGDLSISVYWLLYAAALVGIGFRLNRAVVRSAGLLVAGLAALKVLLFDLSRLEALYRIASFFGLALIALAVAYAYNSRKKATRTSAPSSDPMPPPAEPAASTPP